MNASGEKALEYVNRFKDTESLAIAKMLFRDFPEIYRNIDTARSAVRYRRGANGKENRMKQKLKKPQTPPPRVPKSDAEPWLPYELPKDCKRWLVIADWHWPFHDVQACKIILTHAKDSGCDSVLMLGDMCDCHELSRWEKSPLERKFRDEITLAKEALQGIKEYLKPKRFVWKAGNHEERFCHYLFRHAPALFGIEDFEWENIFKLEKLGVEWITDQRPVTCGRLFLIHGHEFARNMMSPVNPARGVFLRAHECAVVAHSHTPSSHSESTFAERMISCWSIGCGCDLHPRYCRHNRWAHGYGILDVEKDNWQFRNFKIVKQKVRAA